MVLKGVYTRFRCAEVPTIEELRGWFGDDFHACHHQDIRGGVLIEVACKKGVCGTLPEGVADIETSEVHYINFFEDSMVAAGGICVSKGCLAIPAAPMSETCRSATGFLTHVLDDLDMSHPRAVHASSEFQTFTM